MSLSAPNKGTLPTKLTRFRFRLNLGIQALLNQSKCSDFEELLFWGRVEGTKADYYICMGVTFTDKFEFPSKSFYWASSSDFKFAPFPDQLNFQHKDQVDAIKGSFTGDSKHIYI